MAPALEPVTRACSGRAIDPGPRAVESDPIAGGPGRKTRARRARTWDQGARTSAPVDYSPDHDTRTELARPWRLVRLSYAPGRGPGLITLFFPRQ